MHFSRTLLFAALTGTLSAAPVINEIMFHPPGVVEDPRQEWIEVYNPDPIAAPVGGWQLTKGVGFVIPPGTSIPAGGYLVIAADVAAFQAANPSFDGAVVGGWTGRLSNSGEQIQLDDAAGGKVCDVSYADEGDWATRARGPLSFGHKGWIWLNAADGGGCALELRNPALSLESGQNWAMSAALGGSPGAPNSASSTNLAPLIRNAKHHPKIPRSTDPIVISCRVQDEAANPLATLRWRLDGGAWQSLPMTDSDGDGDVDATIPEQGNLAIIEYYIDASDGFNSRTWPAPARTSDIGVVPESFGQVTNALIQIDDSYDPAATFRTSANQPIYRFILTAAERASLVQLQTTSAQVESSAVFNATFISHDGSGVKVRYLCDLGNRGRSSALGPPNNYHVSVPSSDLWNGRKSIGINCRYPYSQALGQALMVRAGVPTQDAAIVRIRLNGVDLSETTARMYRRYVRLEGRSGAWAEHHFPNDPDGNFYRLDDHEMGVLDVPPGNFPSGEFRYEGTNPAAYADTFIKETNKEANDYTDLINLCRIVSAPITGGTAEQPAISNANYVAALESVLDIDATFRFFAADSLIGNMEGGLQTGRGDDVSIYAGVLDPRFRFIPHDLDTCFDIGDTQGGTNRNVFGYDGSNSPGTGVLGLARLFNHPELTPRYYAALLDALNTWFNRATVDPIIDQILGGWVPLTDTTPGITPNRGINDIKAYIDARRTSVLNQIQQNYSLNVTGNAPDTAEGYKVTTTGAATFSGTFNVGRTYSITVNGQLALWFYRPAGSDAAGTWRLAAPAGGGTLLSPGLNRIVVRFWDKPGGTGNILREETANILYNAAGAGSTISGTLAPPGSIAMLAPDGYLPGVPVLVRVDLRDVQGNLNRQAWNTTVNLTASNSVIVTPSTVALYNGMGSALVTFGSGAGGTTQTIFSYGTGGTGGAIGTVTGTPGSVWKYRTDLTAVPDVVGTIPATWKDEGFDDSSWPSGPTQIGYGNNDENWRVARLDNDGNAGNGTQNVPSYLFRNNFTITDLSQVATVTGQIRYDDGYVIYVNGARVAASANVPVGTPLTAYSTNTSVDNATANISIPLANLKTGVNTIAVEIHQGSNNSSDVTFDLRMQLNLLTTDPGNFTLTASAGGLSVNKAITSLVGVTGTTASGTLPSGTTTWSGVVNVTGDVTVPAGATLEIAAGTHVFMQGTSTPGDTTGADIIVSGGTLVVNGTAAQPVSISASDATSKWGQIYLNAAVPTVCNFLLMSGGGHAPGQGHTSRGPMWRLNGASLTLDDCAMGDGPAKALYSSGTGDFIMRRSLMARMITGPETGDGLSILMEDSNIQQILPNYRESNAATPDDEDCLYIHNGQGRPVALRRVVLARCGDDVLDCLGGPITVEDSIIREGWDKGISLLNNDLTLTRTLIVDCDKAIVPKSSTAATRTINVDRCTIISENHDTTLAPWGYNIPPSSPDPDSPSTGLYTQNKSGQSNTSAIIAITAVNTIIMGESPVLVDAPYDPANTVVTYSTTIDTDTPAAPPWAGIGNINADPAFVSVAGDDYHLLPGSPAINTGDPADTDPDGSRADMGALPSGTFGAPAGVITWSPVNGPYRVTANSIVPSGLTLRILAGTSVYFGQNVRLTVNGKLEVLGTPERRVTFSHVPGTVAPGDCDPIKLGTQSGPPKWGGIRIYDSMAEENVVRYADFINAQGTSPSGSENYGSIGFIRSWGWVDHCTWAGTHLRMCYGRNSKMTITWNTFPDMFIFDPAVNRIEEPPDFLASADNNQEPLKIEYPTTDPELAGNPAFTNGQPTGGHFRVYFNDFYGNRGHNDVFDADSGRWGQAGQFLLDCRYNHFHGVSGDEHMDLGGDAYIASNIFERATKDQWTSDTGYSNAISSGDRGTGTTIVVARNLFFDLDHAINLKLSTATIFEHNTVANIVPDFVYNGVSFGTPFTQNVKCAPVNFFIPEDGTNPSYGDGAYLGYNLISNVPRLFSGADARKIGGNVVNDITSKIEFYHNLLDQVGSTDIGPNHPGGIFNPAYGVNNAAAPGFVNAATNDFRLRAASAARAAAPGALDYGWSAPEWAYVLGGPIGVTASTSADFFIGGPGIVAYKWRVDDGAWSAPVQIGAGALFPRTGATERQATLSLNGLANGPHTLEVLGQDAAGNWQDADPARDYDGAPQATPTTRTWTVDTNGPVLLISEVLANGSVAPDTVELFNAGTAPVLLAGWTLTDDPAVPAKFALPGNVLAAGARIAVNGASLNLDKDGDSVFLFQGPFLRDSVTFGPQVLDMSIGRIAVGNTWEWHLGPVTFGLANGRAQVDDMQGIRINEWMASAAARYEDDWIELSNASSFPADISGMHITDNRSGASPHLVLPPLSFIGANAYLKFIADSDDRPGHLPFGLDAESETISLLDPAGGLLDSVTFYPQTTDWSMGRDGAGFAYYELPTAGLANTTTDANALALLRGLRITEIMFNAVGGSDYDFLELRNVGDTAFDLGGVRFVEGITFTFGTLILNPGETIILAKHLSRFRARYGNAPLVAGIYGGQLDNGGEKLALRLPPPFDANILTFEYNDDWFLRADGHGPSLVVTAPAAFRAGDWDDRGTWSQSAPGGDPAGVAARQDTYTGWMALNHALTVAQDDDADGIPALVEFGLGMNPASGLGGDGPLGLPTPSLSASGQMQLTFLVPENALAAAGHGFPDSILRVDASSVLTTWSPIAVKTFGAPWTGNVVIGAAENGYIPVTVTDTAAPGGTRRFLRFRVEWVP